MDRASFESIKRRTFFFATSRCCTRRRYRSARGVTGVARGCTMGAGGSRGRGELLAEYMPWQSVTS